MKTKARGGGRKRIYRAFFSFSLSGSHLFRAVRGTENRRQMRSVKRITKNVRRYFSVKGRWITGWRGGAWKGGVCVRGGVRAGRSGVCGSHGDMVRGMGHLLRSLVSPRGRLARTHTCGAEQRGKNPLNFELLF